MPRPARLIASVFLALALSVTGGAAAYAHGAPGHGITHSHAKKHAPKHKTTLKHAPKKPAKHSTREPGNGKGRDTATTSNAQPAAVTQNIIVGLLTALVGPGVTGDNAGGTTTTTTVTVTAPGGVPSLPGTHEANSVTQRSSTGTHTSGGGQGTNKPPAGSTVPTPSRSATADVPYQALDRPEQRMSAVLVALIAVFVVAMAAMIVGAGHRGRRNAR